MIQSENTYSPPTPSTVERARSVGPSPIPEGCSLLALDLDINPNFVSESSSRFGSQAIVVAIDAKKIDDHYEVFTHGGRNASGINAIEWAKKMADFGAGELLITSMDRDGTKKGFDNNLMKSISDAVDIPIIASGGAGSLRHLVDGIKEGEADAVLAASIFHYGEYSIKEAKKYMYEHGIEMRL